MLGAAAAHENHLEGVAEHSASKRPQTNHSRPANDEHHLADRRRRRALLGSQSPSSDTVWLDDLPDKIREKHLSPSEQAALVRRLRDSVILDAADEAIYKIGRQAARNLTPQVSAPASESSARSSMDSIVSREAPAPRTTVAEEAKAMPDSFYESFRWLEQNEELDLRLYLEDQHTDVREELPPLSPSKTRGPSFRRHLSISKMPFSRSSVSSGRPSTKDVASPVSPSPASLSSAGQQHTRRRSRAMSLVTSKHGAQESISSIDQAAAHYQDPEARLKLRVYLASPQKFDEAIEFGFPSTDVVSPTTTKPEFRSPRRAEFQRGASEDAERLRTFLSDDRSSVYSEEEEEMSVADPDSPKTPLDKPAVRPRVVTEPVQPTKPHAPDNYVHAPVSCREMTLRMTLTRPDLRAREEQIYGWQQRGPYLGRKSQQKQRDVNAPVTYLGEGIPKESIEQVFAGLDHWAPDPGTTVMKRFWNKVRRG